MISHIDNDQDINSFDNSQWRENLKNYVKNRISDDVRLTKLEILYQIHEECTTKIQTFEEEMNHHHRVVYMFKQIEIRKEIEAEFLKKEFFINNVKLCKFIIKNS